MRPLILMAVVIFASCHSIHKTTQTVTHKSDSSTTVTTQTRQDTASLSRLISGKDVNITIRYFNGDQLQEFHDSMLLDTKASIEKSLKKGTGSQIARRKPAEGSDFDFLPDHSRISEIDIHAADVSASTTETASSKQSDSTVKKQVVKTDQHQVETQDKKSVMEWIARPIGKVLAGIVIALVILIIIILWLRRQKNKLEKI